MEVFVLHNEIDVGCSNSFPGSSSVVTMFRRLMNWHRIMVKNDCDSANISEDIGKFWDMFPSN